MKECRNKKRISYSSIEKSSEDGGSDALFIFSNTISIMLGLLVQISPII